MKSNKLVLPCLRGKMGDWFFYVSVMQFKEIAARVSMTDEIHKSESLSRWIQREVSERSKDIVEYLEYQEQRFFNAIIFGLYGGNPSWQEINIENKVKNVDEVEINYLNRTFGILSLSGEEKIFAIDGQHRTKAIKEVINKSEELVEEEVSVIFLAHKKNKQGEVRTRRLFSTLNRYAKPVTVSEIIALDEEDNCAILTRGLIENYDIFKDKILISKNKSINPLNTDSFTNIILLYEMITILLTDKRIMRGLKVSGYDYKQFITRREKENVLDKELMNLQKQFNEIIRRIPSLRKFFKTGRVNRTGHNCSLLFRPIGQLIFFSVLKVASDCNKRSKALAYFAKDTFNLKNRTWRSIFYDEEAERVKTEKSLQKYAIQLILMHLKIEFKPTKREKSLYINFGINPKQL